MGNLEIFVEKLIRTGWKIEHISELSCPKQFNAILLNPYMRNIEIVAFVEDDNVDNFIVWDLSLGFIYLTETEDDALDLAKTLDQDNRKRNRI
jgi:hypothetical protein